MRVIIRRSRVDEEEEREAGGGGGGGGAEKSGLRLLEGAPIAARQGNLNSEHRHQCDFSKRATSHLRASSKRKEREGKSIQTSYLSPHCVREVSAPSSSASLPPQVISRVTLQARPRPKHNVLHPVKPQMIYGRS